MFNGNTEKSNLTVYLAVDAFCCCDYVIIGLCKNRTLLIIFQQVDCPYKSQTPSEFLSVTDSLNDKFIYCWIVKSK